jgi:hypothetical protein
MIPFWCLIPKGEKLRPKQMDQPTTLRILKIVELEFDFVKILKLQKLVSCGRGFFIMGKGRVFCT